jgi:hypothetical protein
MYRHTIDKDIRLNGVNANSMDRKANPRSNGKNNNNMKKYNVFKISAQSPGTPEPREKSRFVPQVNLNSQPPRPSYRPTNNYNNKGGNQQDMRAAWRDKYGMKESRPKPRDSNSKAGDRPRNSQGRFQKGPNKPNNRYNNNNKQGSYNKNYCSLCGKTDHRAVDGCPNMVSDNGRRVNILPSKDTCQPALGTYSQD